MTQRGELGEQRRLVGVIREEELDLPEPGPPTTRARRGTRASPPPSRARSSPCRGRAGERPPAAGRAAREPLPIDGHEGAGHPRGRTSRRAVGDLRVERRREPRREGRAPAARERGPRRLLVRPDGRAGAARERRPEVREPAFPGDAVPAASTSSRPPPGDRAPRGGRAGTERRPAGAARAPCRRPRARGAGRCTPGSPPRRGRPGSRSAAPRRARRGARTAAPTARRRRASPRTGRSSAPRGAATGPGSRARGRAGSTISSTAATAWIARPAPISATSSSSRRQPVAAPPRRSASRRSSGARAPAGRWGPSPRSRR